MKLTKKPFVTGVAVLILLIGVSVAFSGGVSAYEPETVTLSELDGDAKYQGQELKVDVSALNVSANASVYFIKIDDEDNTNNVETLTHGGNDIINIEDTQSRATGLEYGFSDTTTVSAENVSGVFTLNSDSFSAEWDTERVSDQDTAEIEISSDRIPEYPITIKANGIEYSELSSLFSGASVSEDADNVPFEDLGYDPDTTSVEDVKDDGYITLTDWDNGDGNIDAQFNKLSDEDGLPTAGEYNFELTVADTGTTDNTTIEIGSSTEKASFSSTTYRTNAGDLLEFTVDMTDTDTTFVQIGGKGSGFVDVLYIERESSGSGVTVTANTRLLGTNPALNTRDVYEAENVDDFTSAYHANGEAPFTGNPTVGNVDVFMDGSPMSGTSALSYPGYISGAEIASSSSRTDMLIRNLQPTQYTLLAAGTKNLDPSSEAVFQADEAKPTDTLAQATAVLEQPSPTDVTVYKAPKAPADSEGSISDVLDSATETTEVAEGDQLIVEFETTGVFGGMIAGPDGDTADDIDFDRGGRVDTEFIQDYIESVDGLNFEIEGATTVGNQQAPEIALNETSDRTNAYIDREEERFIIVADTSSDKSFTTSDIGGFGTYTAKLEFSGDEADDGYKFEDEDPSNGAFSAADGRENHPYVDADDGISIEQEFDINPKRVEFDNTFEEGIQLQPTESSEISGETNIAPGSDVSIRLVSKGAEEYFEQKPSVSISGGSFSTTVDLSNREKNEEISVEFVTNGETVESADAVVTGDIESVEVPERNETAVENQTDNSEPTNNQNDGEQNDGEQNDGEQSENSSQVNVESENNSTEEGLPGFGAITALVAVVLSVVIVMRKE